MKLLNTLNLMALSLFASVSVSANAKLEYVPVGEVHVRGALAKIAAGGHIVMLSANADAATVELARYAAGECPLGRRVIHNRPGWSVAQVNLNCSGGEQIGFALIFLQGKLEGMEIYPTGVELVAPPASPNPNTGGNR